MITLGAPTTSYIVCAWCALIRNPQVYLAIFLLMLNHDHMMGVCLMIISWYPFMIVHEWFLIVIHSSGFTSQVNMHHCAYTRIQWIMFCPLHRSYCPERKSMREANVSTTLNLQIMIRWPLVYTWESLKQGLLAAIAVSVSVSIRIRVALPIEPNSSITSTIQVWKWTQTCFVYGCGHAYRYGPGNRRVES